MWPPSCVSHCRCWMVWTPLTRSFSVRECGDEQCVLLLNRIQSVPAQQAGTPASHQLSTETGDFLTLGSILVAVVLLDKSLKAKAKRTAMKAMTDIPNSMPPTVLEKAPGDLLLVGTTLVSGRLPHATDASRLRHNWDRCDQHATVAWRCGTNSSW